MNKIIIVCSSGLGTSLMLRLSLEVILREWSIKAEVVNMDKSSVTSETPNIIIGAKQIVDSIETHPEIEIIPLENIVDSHYLRICLKESKTIQKWLLEN